MKSYYLPGSVLPIHRWGSGSCEKLSNLLKFTQAIGSWESGRELNYVSFQNFSEQSACIRKGRHCVEHSKGLKCTRCSPSVPGAFSVLEEAPDPSPPSWVAVPACADGLSPSRTLSTDGCPPAPASQCRLHEPSRDSVYTLGLWRRSARLLWAMFYIEFLLVAVGSHRGRVGKHPSMWHPAAEPAPVGWNLGASFLSHRKVKSL